MNFKCLFINTFAFILFNINVYAQNEESNGDELIENVVESVSENNAEDVDFADITDKLNYYKKHPINLNKANKEQLQDLTFLNPIQINALLNHIHVNGKLIDFLELQSLDAFDLQTIKKLGYFSYVTEPLGFETARLKKLIADANYDFLIRYQRVLQKQKGYFDVDNDKQSHYIGSPDKVFTRLRYNYKQKLSISLNTEKDAGEPLGFSETYPSPDFVSGNIYLKNFGAIKKLVVGNYSLQFGQGLSMWSGLSFGKGADIFSVAKQDVGLKPYNSVNEFSFLQGLSTQINWKKWEFTPFISYQKLDASAVINPQTNSIEIGNLQQSGLHRTHSEIKNKNRVLEKLIGANLSYKSRSVHVGFTAYKNNFSQKFATADATYNQFDFNQNNLTNLALNYNFTLQNTYFFGEFAQTLNYGYAYLNGFMSSLSPKLSLVGLQRNYQRNYYSFYNQAISEATQAVNEKGFYLGLQVKPVQKIEWLTYVDVFKFPWLKYQVDAPSNGYEILSQVKYQPNKTMYLLLRYRNENKQQNTSNPENIKYVIPVNKENYRLEIQYQTSKSISLRNRIEVIKYQKESLKPELGFMAYQDISYQPMGKKLSGNLRFTLFQTTGFNSRIYAYENDVLYGFSIPAYQNEGLRFYINGRYTIKKGLDFWVRYALTNYFDKNQIGTGLELIDGNKKSEIKLQARMYL